MRYISCRYGGFCPAGAAVASQVQPGAVAQLKAYSACLIHVRQHGGNAAEALRLISPAHRAGVKR